jgi:hypothetical protein
MAKKKADKALKKALKKMKKGGKKGKKALKRVERVEEAVKAQGGRVDALTRTVAFQVKDRQEPRQNE